MVKATGKKLWRRTVEVLFRQLICHKWGGNFLWVSVDHIPGSLNDEAKYDNEGDRPDWHNIVTDDMKYSSTALRRFIDQGAKMMEALSCVYDEDTLARTLLGTEVLTRSAQKARSANKATPLSAGAVNDIVIKTAGGGGDDGDDDDGDDDDEEEEGDVNSASANMLSRHSGGNSGVGGGAPADGNAASRTSNADADAVQPDAPPVRDGVVGKVETLTADLKALRISKSKKSFSKKEKKKIGHLHYETAQILREGGDEIAANPKDGGRPMYFVRVAKSLGGKSKSTVSRGAAAATSFLKKCWDLFAEIASLIRTTRKLSAAEEDTLLELIDDFLKAYEDINASITIKVHMLVHLFLFLAEYGPPGLFAEDSIESGHAVINQLTRRYAPLDEERRIKQILRAWKARKIVRGQDEKKKKKAEAAAGSGTGSKKRKRKQGSGEGDGSAIEEATVKAIGRCIGILTEIGDSNDDGSDPDPRQMEIPRELYRCGHCSEQLEEDKQVPVCFRELHDLLYHTATEDKHYAKKAKT